MTIYMLTMPWNAASKKMINLYLTRNDIHDWTIGYEVGRDGYRHIHVRLNARSTFNELLHSFPGAHIEEGSTEDDWYERKDGHFVCSKDTVDVRRCRFGRLRSNQQKVLELLDRQNDRGVLVWFDSTGGVGKSFFTRWLVERGRAYYVPPTVDNSKQIIQYVCAGYKGQPYIVIDIPRSAKWNQSLYAAIESIKDGLVYDTRYTAKIRDIWGCKILVLTNSMPNLDALSKDRWTIYEEKPTENAEHLSDGTEQHRSGHTKSTDGNQDHQKKPRQMGKKKRRREDEERKVGGVVLNVTL